MGAGEMVNACAWPTDETNVEIGANAYVIFTGAIGAHESASAKVTAPPSSTMNGCGNKEDRIPGVTSSMNRTETEATAPVTAAVNIESDEFKANVRKNITGSLPRYTPSFGENNVKLVSLIALDQFSDTTLGVTTTTE